MSGMLRDLIVFEVVMGLLMLLNLWVGYHVILCLLAGK